MPGPMHAESTILPDTPDAGPDRAPDQRQDQAAQPPSPPHAGLLAGVEALLFSSDRPLKPAAIAQSIGAAGLAQEATGDAGAVPSAVAMVESAVEALNRIYDQSGRAFRIEPVAGGLRVMTRPEHAGLLAAHHRAGAPARLSRAAVETLAVIAYKQPLTRGKLEAIRGVACGEVLRTLLERGLIAITGRAEELGRPMLYGTTRKFLDSFGLGSLKDLPGAGELAAPPAQDRPPTPPQDGSAPQPSAGSGRNGP